MDTRIEPAGTAVDRGRKMGVAGGQHCASCGVIVHWRIEKFCQSLPLRFGGRIYCLRCQKSFPALAR